MSVISTIVDAINPHENEETHREARAKARAAARPGDWLSLILQHHEQIEASFAGVKAASTAAAQTRAQKHLAVLLTGHANAEEAAIYPALSRAEKKSEATTAYSEQATAKQEMATLEMLAPLSQEYLQKLEHVRDAVAHHVYEEESNWFLALMHDVTAEEQLTMGRRYREEFDRYVGTEAQDSSLASQPSAATQGYGRIADPSAPISRPMS